MAGAADLRVFRQLFQTIPHALRPTVGQRMLGIGGKPGMKIVAFRSRTVFGTQACEPALGFLLDDFHVAYGVHVDWPLSNTLCQRASADRERVCNLILNGSLRCAETACDVPVAQA